MIAKIIFSFILISPVFIVHAQSTAGLVAHWPMNNGCDDISGNGHNGTPHNLKSVVGKGGYANTALYFSGSSDINSASYISVPYAPDLNINNYTICATIKVTGFYSGNCQVNMLLTRGRPGSPGCYSLLFFDNAFTSCSILDTTKETFAAWGGTDGTSSVTDWQYAQSISENQWMSVVATYDGINYNVYVNGNLMVSPAIPYHTPMSATTDSLIIGYDLFEASAGYPYPFKGVIDDMMVYNRVLTASEINDYTSLAVNDIKTQASKALHIFPNPASKELYITLDQPTNNAQLKVYNQLGQVVKSNRLQGNNIKVDTNDLAAGVYFVQVINGNSILSDKFLKQ